MFSKQYADAGQSKSARKGHNHDTSEYEGWHDRRKCQAWLNKASSECAGCLMTCADVDSSMKASFDVHRPTLNRNVSSDAGARTRLGSMSGSGSSGRRASASGAYSASSGDWWYRPGTPDPVNGSRKYSVAFDQPSPNPPLTRLGSTTHLQYAQNRTPSVSSAASSNANNPVSSLRGLIVRTPMSDYSDCNLMPRAFSQPGLSAKQTQDAQMTRLSRPKHVNKKHVSSGRSLLNTGKHQSVGDMQLQLLYMEQEIDKSYTTQGYEAVDWPPLRLPPGTSWATNALWKAHGVLLKDAVDMKVISLIQKGWPDMYNKLF